MESQFGAEGFFEGEGCFPALLDDGFDGAFCGCFEGADIACAGGGGFAAVEGVVDFEFAAGDFAVGDGFDVDGGEVGIELASLAENGAEDEGVVFARGGEEEAGFAHEGAALRGDRWAGVAVVSVFEREKAGITGESCDDGVFSVGLENAAGVQGVDCYQGMVRDGVVGGELEPGGRICGLMAVAGDFLAAVSRDGDDGAGLPGDHPLALHFVGLGAGFVDAEGFAIDEKFDFLGIGISLHGDEGAGGDLGVGPMGEDVHHGFGCPLALVEVEVVFAKAGEVVGSASEGVEGPASMDIASFAGVVESSPAEGSRQPRKVAHFFPMLAGVDAHGGVVVGGGEDLFAVGHLVGCEKGVGKDFFFGEVGDLERTLPLVRISVAIPSL